MKEFKFTGLKKEMLQLKAGEQILFSGIIYTARDQAHAKLIDLIKRNKKLPLDIENQIIYYCGPTLAPKGKIIGACGPTTASRMDSFIEPLLKKGLAAMIGKGRRLRQVRQLIKKYKSVYFVAPAGCGAFLAKRVISMTIVCFKELGPEAVCRLEVTNFPLIVAIDSRGESIYDDL